MTPRPAAPVLTGPAEIIAGLRRQISDGEPWFEALLAAVRAWPAASEEVAGREYHYLVGGEAFDWLLLAERLCDELQGLVPDDEREALLFHGRPPGGITDEDLQRLLGAKARSHLNFVYGVRVEEALQLAVEIEVRKERASRVWDNGHDGDEVHRRIYGAGAAELLAEFRAALKLPAGDGLSLSELNEFTYWLFKRRLRNADPARVASDTRKGLAQLQRLDALRARTSALG
jgi:hypothetical protein